jgi:hypothetical protein
MSPFKIIRAVQKAWTGEIPLRKGGKGGPLFTMQTAIPGIITDPA